MAVGGTKCRCKQNTNDEWTNFNFQRLRLKIIIMGNVHIGGKIGTVPGIYITRAPFMSRCIWSISLPCLCYPLPPNYSIGWVYALIIDGPINYYLLTVTLIWDFRLASSLRRPSARMVTACLEALYISFPCSIDRRCPAMLKEKDNNIYILVLN